MTLFSPNLDACVAANCLMLHQESQQGMTSPSQYHFVDHFIRQQRIRAFQLTLIKPTESE